MSESELQTRIEVNGRPICVIKMMGIVFIFVHDTGIAVMGCSKCLDRRDNSSCGRLIRLKEPKKYICMSCNERVTVR